MSLGSDLDIMMPSDRPSWAIGTMVAHRLFSNLVGDDQMLSPNFWTATSLNESRMSCDNTIVPNRVNHCNINSGVNQCQTDGVGNVGGLTVNNCFQVLNIGYAQIANNQPDLFSQTNAYGTASFSNVVGSDQYESAAIAVAYYHYQDIRYWNQIFCWNAIQFNEDAPGVNLIQQPQTAKIEINGKLVSSDRNIPNSWINFFIF